MTAILEKPLMMTEDNALYERAGIFIIELRVTAAGELNTGAS